MKKSPPAKKSLFASRVVAHCPSRHQTVPVTDQGKGFDWHKYMNFDPERAFDYPRPGHRHGQQTQLRPDRVSRQRRRVVTVLDLNPVPRVLVACAIDGDSRHNPTRIFVVNLSARLIYRMVRVDTSATNDPSASLQLPDPTSRAAILGQHGKIHHTCRGTVRGTTTVSMV